jgi:hypothetical protein
MNQASPERPGLIAALATELKASLDCTKAALESEVSPEQLRYIIRRLRQAQRQILRTFPDLPLPGPTPPCRPSDELQLWTRRVRALRKTQARLPESILQRIPVIETMLLDMKLREQIDAELHTLRAVTMVLLHHHHEDIQEAMWQSLRAVLPTGGDPN